MKKCLLNMAALAWTLTSPCLVSAAEVDILLEKPLVAAPGLSGQVLTVSYAPGEASDPHMHNAQVFVYVLEGSVVMQVRDGEPVTLQAGDTFYEAPDDVHMVSRNASDTLPAKFLVFFVKQEGEPVSVPVTDVQ